MEKNLQNFCVLYEKCKIMKTYPHKMRGKIDGEGAAINAAQKKKRHRHQMPG